MEHKVIELGNMLSGGIVAILTMLFGAYWYIFAGYLILQVMDWLTGWYKARRKRVESSSIGARGAIKKTMYWACITVAFLFSYIFERLGNDVLHLDLSFVQFIGWFTLATFLVNETRSVLENLKELGVKIPDVLTRGLSVTQKLLEKETDNIKNESEELENEENKSN